MQPTPQAYWDTRRKEVQVVWGIGGRRRHFRLPPHPANLDVLSVEAINDNELAIYYGREGGRPQWVQVVGIMSGGVHLSTNWQAYLTGVARRMQQEQSLVRLGQQQQSLVRLAQQQRRSEQQERDRQRREAEARAREQREQANRALAVRPRAEAPSVRCAVPSRTDAQPGLLARREFIESRSTGGYYNEDDFECDDCGGSVPRHYAITYDVMPKPRRTNRTGWTWLGGLLAFIAGLVGLVLSAAAPTSGPMPIAEAFAVLSTIFVALFGLIGIIWPRIGGVAVLLFGILGTGLSGSTGPRAAMITAFVGGLKLWFGRRNHARYGTMRKLVRVTVLAGVSALTIAEHIPTRHTAPGNTAATSPVRNRRTQRARREVSATTTKAIDGK